MAKVKEATGYEPFKSPNDIAQPHVENPPVVERTFVPVQARTKREEQPLPTVPSLLENGKALHDELIRTGTNPDNLKSLKVWLHANPKAKPEEAFEFLDAIDPPLTEGTIRKAGKAIWGPLWEPARAVLQAPTEEINRLRGQVDDHEKTIAMKNARIAGLEMQCAELIDKSNELAKKISFLSAGKTQEQLAALVGAGHNVLAGETA